MSDVQTSNTLFNPDDLSEWNQTSIEAFVENAITEIATDIANIQLALDLLENRSEVNADITKQEALDSKAISSAQESAQQIQAILKTMSAYTHKYKKEQKRAG